MRWPLWLLATALLLKAAMPWLASEAADWQGKTAFQICSVHGISIDAAAADNDASRRDNAPASQREEHCALSAIGALATGAPPATSPLSVLSCEASVLRTHAPSQAPDACGVWIARLKHGPPDLS